MNIRKHFEENAPMYSEHVTLFFKANYEYVENYIKFISPSRIADIASGDGYMATRLEGVTKGYVVGLEQSHALNAIAISRSSSVEWIIGDAHSLPFTNEKFDFVICNLSMNLFSNPRIVLEELQRITIDGGEIMISTLGNIHLGNNIQHEKSIMCDQIYQLITSSQLFVEKYVQLESTIIVTKLKDLINFFRGEVGPWNNHGFLDNLEEMITNKSTKLKELLTINLKFNVYHLIRKKTLEA